eukprot:m.5885 g.5885  ORF g.5885 m.5885 type:complete len:63 (-) comp5100_c0_seq2:75-263(-)
MTLRLMMKRSLFDGTLSPLCSRLRHRNMLLAVEVAHMNCNRRISSQTSMTHEACTSTHHANT